MLNTFIFIAFIAVGIALNFWARVTLEGFWGWRHDRINWPWALSGDSVCHCGPYRWVNHPAYLGTLFFVMGLAGLAAGWWNVLAVGTVCELLLREWAWRERGFFDGWHR